MTAAQQLALSAYGKLPLSREFLRIGCREPIERSFRALLDQAAKHVTGKDPAQAGSVQLAAGAPGEQRLLAACVWPSADQGHMRPFPFSLLTAAALAEDALPTDLWSTLEPVFEQLERAALEARALPDAVAFDRTFAARTCAFAATNADRAAAPPITLAAWASQAFGEDSEVVAAALWRLRLNAQASAPRAVVRAPLAPSLPVAAQVEAWVRAAVGPRLPLPAALVVHRRPGGAASVLSILRRPLRAGDIGSAPEPADDVVDLTRYREPSVVAGFGRFCDRLSSRLGASMLAELATLLEE